MDHKGPIREAASRELEGQRPSVLDICPIRPLLARARAILKEQLLSLHTLGNRGATLLERMH